MPRAVLTLAVAILTALPAAAGTVYEATTTIESSQPGQAQRCASVGWCTLNRPAFRGGSTL